MDSDSQAAFEKWARLPIINLNLQTVEPKKNQIGGYVTYRDPVTEIARAAWCGGQGAPTPTSERIGVKHVPVPVKKIIHALEREAANTDTDPRWLAASQLRNMSDWERRTLMCFVDVDPPSVAVTATV